MALWTEGSSATKDDPETASDKSPDILEDDPVHDGSPLPPVESRHLVVHTEPEQVLKELPLLPHCLVDPLVDPVQHQGHS